MPSKTEVINIAIELNSMKKDDFEGYKLIRNLILKINKNKK